mgnify:CR=1 FL=1
MKLPWHFKSLLLGLLLGIGHYALAQGAKTSAPVNLPPSQLKPGEFIWAAEAVPDAIETIVATYLAQRLDRSETFLAAYRRLGKTPFRAALYGADATRQSAPVLEDADV